MEGARGSNGGKADGFEVTPEEPIGSDPLNHRDENDSRGATAEGDAFRSAKVGLGIDGAVAVEATRGSALAVREKIPEQPGDLLVDDETDSIHADDQEGDALTRDDFNKALPSTKPNDSVTKSVVVGACVALLAALTVLGSVLNVGDHLAAAHPVLGWVFYLLLLVIVVVGIVVPLVKVAQRPIFSLYQLRDEKGHAKRRWCRMLADNLIDNTDLSDEDAAKLLKMLDQGDNADDLLIEFFNEHCIPKIDDETKRAASTAFFISAVSRSPLVSTVTMLSLCLDLVRSIVEVCGFRPTNAGLARLYTRVMLSALIIGGIEDSDLSDMLGQLMGGGAGARAGGIVIGATAEGLVSAFLVFRVGVLTKKWLTAVDGPATMRALRRSSYREALAMMKTSGFMQTVTDTLKQTTGTVASSMANAVKTTTDNVATSVADTVTQAAHSTADAVTQTARSTVESAKSRVAAARSAFSAKFK